MAQGGLIGGVSLTLMGDLTSGVHIHILTSEIRHRRLKSLCLFQHLNISLGGMQTAIEKKTGDSDEVNLIPLF